MYDDFWARQQAELEEYEGQRMTPPAHDAAGCEYEPTPWEADEAPCEKRNGSDENGRE